MVCDSLRLTLDRAAGRTASGPQWCVRVRVCADLVWKMTVIYYFFSDYTSVVQIFWQVQLLMLEFRERILTMWRIQMRKVWGVSSSVLTFYRGLRSLHTILRLLHPSVTSSPFRVPLHTPSPLLTNATFCIVTGTVIFILQFFWFCKKTQYCIVSPPPPYFQLPSEITVLVWVKSNEISR